MSKRKQLHAHQIGELAGDLGLADAGRAGEQVAADRLLRLAQARPRQLDRRGQRLDRLVLAEHDALQVLLEIGEDFGVVLGDGLGRNARHGGDGRLDLLHGDLLLALVLRDQHLRGARLVDHVDRLVGQLAVVDVLGRQLHRRLDGVVGVFELVEALEVGLQALQDRDRVLDRGLLHVDLLEAADERAILLEVLAVLLVGGRADAAHGARLQRGLQQVGGVHGAARGGAGADHGVDLVDEQDRARIVLDLLHHRLQALLEVAAIARAGEQRAHVEREDGGVQQNLGHLALDDLAGEPFGDCGLADAGVADEQRVVLLAAAQHLDRAQHLGLAPDEGIDLAFARLLVEVDAVGVEGVLARLPLLALDGLLLVDAAHVAWLRHAGPLGDAVADVLDRVEARHLLLLQEIGGVALALGEDGDEHVGAGHLLAARGLHVHDGAMDDALEAGRRLGLRGLLGDKRAEIVVEIARDARAQRLEVDRAGAHDRGGVAVVQKSKQQMLERRVLVATLVGGFQSAMQRAFQALREGRQGGPTLSPWCTVEDDRSDVKNP